MSRLGFLWLGLPALLAGASEPPPAALVRGVPFISWREAAGLSYPSKNILNPSHIAARRMVLGYWDSTLPADLSGDLVVKRYLGNPALRTGDHATLPQLKEFIARGLPVVVNLPLTPEGHPFYQTFAIMKELGQVKVSWPTGSKSGALGDIMPLDVVPAFKEALKGTNPLNESVTAAVRVVIGYDEPRGVIVVHDPSFGPAVELPESEFSAMWSAADARWQVLEPPDAEAVIRSRVGAPSYRARTADEFAAERFAHGYVHSALRQMAEGERDLREALALDGVGPGYRHLLNLELALNLQSQMRLDEARLPAEEATRLVPENDRGWLALALIGRLSYDGKLQARAEREGKKALKALEKESGRQRLAQLIPADFFVDYLGKLRGWGGGAPAAPVSALWVDPGADRRAVNRTSGNSLGAAPASRMGCGVPCR